MAKTKTTVEDSSDLIVSEKIVKKKPLIKISNDTSTIDRPKKAKAKLLPIIHTDTTLDVDSEKNVIEKKSKSTLDKGKIIKPSIKKNSELSEVNHGVDNEIDKKTEEAKSFQETNSSQLEFQNKTDINLKKDASEALPSQPKFSNSNHQNRPQNNFNNSSNLGNKTNHHNSGFTKPVAPINPSVPVKLSATSNVNNYKITDLEVKTIAELRNIAGLMNIESVGELNKHDLIIKILSVATQSQGNNIPVEGILEIMSDNTHGVLRSMRLIPSENDVYVSLSQIRRFNMRMGDYVVGVARLPKDNERYLSLLRVDSINGTKAEEATNRPYFERMTPIFPNKIMKMESDEETLSTRLIDMLSPIGYGQRGMVVAPPKAGKTWLLKDIAKGIAKNHPEIHLMVVLIAERPEEVTDMARFVKGEVFSANFDDSAEVQVKVAELSLERAKRMVESGYDVVILLDSITRLARAYNVVMPTSGRTLSGGMDPIALYPPKRFFGAARNFEVGKSLTIIATALVDTGSKMDDVVFEEFKGTGNMELHLDRSLAERRVYPSVNIKESSTRNEELLLGRENLAKIWGIRRLIDEMKPIDAINAISDRLKKTKTNQLFLDTIHEII